MISTKTMHRKPTYTELIYDMENTKLKDFKIDREATILRRRPELTRFDDDSFLDLNNMHEIKKNMARSAYQQIYQVDHAAATSAAVASATAATASATAMTQQAADTSAIQTSLFTLALAPFHAASTISEGSTSYQGIQDAATAAENENAQNVAAQSQNLLSSVASSLASSSSQAQEAVLPPLIPLIPPTDLPSSTPLIPPIIPEPVTFNISEETDERENIIYDILQKIKNDSVLVANITEPKKKLYLSDIKNRMDDSDYNIIKNYAPVETMFIIFSVINYPDLKRNEKKAIFEKILFELNNIKLETIESSASALPESAYDISIAEPELTTGSPPDVTEPPLEVPELELEIETPVSVKINALYDEFYNEKEATTAELKKIKNRSTPPNMYYKNLLELVIKTISLKNEYCTGVDKTDLNKYINEIKKYLTTTRDGQTLIKKTNMSINQQNKLNEIKSATVDIINKVQKRIP